MTDHDRSDLISPADLYGVPAEIAAAAGTRPQWMLDDPELRHLVAPPAPRLFCADPECPDYGSPDFGEGTCPSEHAELPHPLDDIDPGEAEWAEWDWEEEKPTSRRERLRSALTAYRLLHRRRLARIDRDVTVWIDMRTWMVGATFYAHRGFTVRVGPLSVTLVEPPF